MSLNLESLEPTSKLSDRVFRILGQNPGKFTLQGTNTYLVGNRPPWILIDAGEGKPAYTEILEQKLEEAADYNGDLISDIIITHRHGDHHGGLPSIVDLKLLKAQPNPPRLHKFPLDDTSGVNAFIRKSTMMVDNTLPDTLAALGACPGCYTAASEGKQLPHFHDLRDRQEFTTSEGAKLTVIHTPGHTTDSIALLLEDEGDRFALFTADSVLGQGTAVFEDLATYMQSLETMKAALGGKTGRLYPGHGPVIEDGLAVITEYIKHRKLREDEIVEVLKTTPPEESAGWTIERLVQKIYAAYPQSLWPAAGFGIALHLLKLQSEGRARVANDVAGDDMRAMVWEIDQSKL